MHLGKKRKHPALNNKMTTMTITVISILIFTILVLPSLVVLPATFTQSDQIEEQGQLFDQNQQFSADENELAVEVLRTQTDQVETVPLEEYVVGVVASEMPAEFEIEALKAQALAARTYVIQFMSVSNGGEENVNIKDTVEHQVYRSREELQQLWGSDYHWKIDKITQAVSATQGEILTFEDQLITPAFFSTSNGYTENAEDYWENELPYLRSVPSPWDEDSPRYLDQEILPISEVEQKLEISWVNTNNEYAITRTNTNRIETIELAGTMFTGREVREKLGLRSTDFEIEQKDDHLIFTTKGYGHGVGMSQYGANGMALEGKDYLEIVHYYYDGVTVDTVAEAAPALYVQN